MSRRRVVLSTLARRSADGRTVTAAQIEAGGGLPRPELRELMGAFGLPVPADDEPAFTPSEAEALTAVWQGRDAWPFELTVQISRVYGRLLARIAQATIQLWISVVEPGLDDDLEKALEVSDMLPVSDALLAGVHRRWLEREAEQMAFRDSPVAAGEHAELGAIEVSFLFCDLKDFTAFADRQGDDAAVRIIDRFATVVTRERGPDARLTKLLGDGFMCAYPEPRLAVQAGARIIDTMREPGLPGVHASVHHGLAIPREGDYFGSAVNLTARLLREAGRDELVATRTVVEQCPELDWEHTCVAQFRGIEAEVEVFTLRR
jgi:adenylate cyclase